MKKIIRIGQVPREGDFFCKIEIEGGKLSISGVIGPMANGDAHGSCGQVCMSFKESDKRGHLSFEDLKLAPGWTPAKVKEFFYVWDRWHLNDMKPNCEHQVGPAWDSGREIVLYYFRLKKSVIEARHAAKHRAKESIKTGSTFTPTAEETRIANLPDKLTLDAPELPVRLAADYEADGPQYSGDHYNKASETKTAGWVKPDEHPRGILCKPCPVCGYHYGSEWRKEALPQSVVDFLTNLPDTDKTPAWV